MNYDKAIKVLTAKDNFCIKLGLERIKSLMAKYDNPQDKIKVIHIAGTNGKGSVASTLANILKCAGFKTGLYTSPHLVEYTERIKINNIQIPKDVFAQYIEDISTSAKTENIALTEFEILTAVMFKYFYDEKVNYAIVETGLGGRFDATNIIKQPILEIITSISKDHTDRLGNTIEKIAFEKAGIIKDNSDVIISENNQGYKVIEETAQNKQARLHSVQKDIEITFENGTNYAEITNKKYLFPLLGLYQKQNLALVLEAARFLGNIPDNALTEGLKTVNWGARLEYIKEKNILIDGAHNPDAAIQLKKSLDYYFKNQKKVFIYSSLTTKDYKTVCNTLFNGEDEIYFYEFNHKDALSFKEFKSAMPQLKHLYKFSSDKLAQIIQKNCLKVVTGSLYMIGDLYLKLTSL